MKLTIRLQIEQIPPQDPPPPAWALSLLAAINRLENKMSEFDAAIDELGAAVAENTTVDGSVMALVEDIAARLAAAAQNPAAVLALAGELRAKNAALAAFVVANTPVAPQV